MSLLGWKPALLGEHCEVFSGFPFKSDGFTDDPNDISLVKGENIAQGKILWEISKRWSRQDAADLERYKLVAGDVVLAMDRPWIPAGLKFARISETAPESLLVQRAARLRARDGLDQRYLAHVIASPQFTSYVQNIARGVGVPHISGKEIGAFQFPLPPKAIQAEIANVLFAYDDLIENNRRRIQLLEESARLLYREWFVHLRFPGHEHVRVADGVPEGWERLPLGEVLTLQRGFDLPVSARTEGSIPIYASTGINGFHNQAMVRGPGVVTGRSGSLGTVMYVLEDFWPLNTALWVKEFKCVPPVFAYHLLNGMQLAQYNGGAAVPTLNRNDVHRVEVLCPPTRLSSEFAVEVEPIYRQVTVLNEQNKKLAQARDLLLPRLMSGEITV